MVKYKPLVSMQTSGTIDLKAQEEWGFNTHALIEAAAQSCSKAFLKAIPDFFEHKSNKAPKILVLAGHGNNAADALSLLRHWLLQGLAQPEYSSVIISRLPDIESKDNNPPAPIYCLYKSLKKMQVPFFEWNQAAQKPLISDCDTVYDLIIDGIAGTGVRTALTGNLLEMTKKLNDVSNTSFSKKPLIVSIDIPSGLCDSWVFGDPIVHADLTLAIEPLKHCLYKPKSRSSSGNILFVKNLFPQDLVDSLTEDSKKTMLISWDNAQKEIPGFMPDIHKYNRGTVEIHAGCKGSAGAAIIAARASQAAGAGLVRLIVDNEIYSIAASGLASIAAGIMVSTNNTEDNITENNDDKKRFSPDSLVLGPGWGRLPSRTAILQKALGLEKDGIPLLLDADGIYLAKDIVFSGNTLLTPHIGEFACFTGLSQKQIENDPVPIMLEFSAKKNAFILLKSHVMYISSPDGKWSIIDGMVPVLASGGSGDLLAGFCASFMARMALNNRVPDIFTCAAAAAALLIQAGKDLESKGRITDPLDIADQAANLAGLVLLQNQLCYKTSFVKEQ